MKKIRIAIVDVIGLTYDATTMEKYGLGGSESAVVRMAAELAKHENFEVRVFNNCIDSRAAEGKYNGVEYVDISRLLDRNDYTCDVMVASRTVIPFLPSEHWGSFNYSGESFQQLKNSSSLKILWMHDTFCSGDHLLEELVVNGHIDQIFTLSDFHTTYVSNCQHGGPKRNFEVLKNKIFMTRNGATKYFETDISKKDKNHFVYNASITKGMLPLVLEVWPLVKKRIPAARLTVVGGYYRFRDGAPPDAQEAEWHRLVARDDLKKSNITFTGVIPQRQIADILANASFMIYPAAFPETFGISTLESLLYNTPLITNRFGALEETAIDLASYKLNYAIEPNSLFPEINKQEQVQKFAELVTAAYHAEYMNYQKMHACFQVHDIAGWDTVALQWKQQIFKTLGEYLPVDEYRKVNQINHKVHRVYGRRFSNPVEHGWPKISSEQKILVASPVYNAEKWVGSCIRSIAQQDYGNYRHLIVDDASTDNTVRVIHDTIKSLSPEIQDRFVVIENAKNIGSLQNYVYCSNYALKNDYDITMMVDGDDSLMNDNTIFDYYNTLYAQDKTEFTYGSMWSIADKIPLIAQPYPKEVREKKTYRKHRYPWNMPYTHLRTFKSSLFSTFDESVCLDEKGKYFRAGGDTVLFYELIERANPDKIVAVPYVMYRYNDVNPMNDYKIHGEEQNRTAKMVMEQHTKQSTPVSTTKNKIRILLAIPTAKYVETSTFKSIWDLDIPEHVEIDLNFYYGYQIDQIRNLIANWAEQYDYLFSVDSDIVLPKDTLTKMLNHNVDMVSGVYIQRRPDVEVPEIYFKRPNGDISNCNMQELPQSGLVEIAGCGFGCVLINSNIIRKMKYPHFVYKSALNHQQTVSEDIYFCMKATELGAKIFVDPTIVCDHIGQTTFKPTTR